MSIVDEINQKLDELYQKINPNDFSWINEAKEVFGLFIKFEKLQDYKKSLECIIRDIEKDNTKIKEYKEVQGLLNELQKYEPNFLIENLKRRGYALAKNNKSLKDAINKESMRILEQTRLGKRDTVIGMLMRNFAIRNVSVPSELIEALKPKYDINLFRAFIYAFLSGFIITEE